MSAIRLDKLLTIGVVQPALNALRQLRRIEPDSSTENRVIPILMYHSISDEPQASVAPYFRTATSPIRFAEHMRWLHDDGWRGVNLAEALQVSGRSAARSEKLVALTSDDGFRDFYSDALPVLERYKFTATMYLPTKFISAERRSFLGRQCLTWEEVRELRGRGMHFGSHSVTHPKLYELSWAEIEQELKVSKDHIENELNEEVTSFAYPYAFPQEDKAFAAKLATLLENCGYHDCVTTAIGRAKLGRHTHYLRRLPINSCDDFSLLRAKLNGGYDWLSIPQRLLRRIRSPISLRAARDRRVEERAL